MLKEIREVITYNGRIKGFKDTTINTEHIVSIESSNLRLSPDGESYSIINTIKGSHVIEGSVSKVTNFLKELSEQKPLDSSKQLLKD